MTRQVGFIILAVLLFLLALALVAFSWGTAKDVTMLTLGGLASFAAGHLP